MHGGGNASWVQGVQVSLTPHTHPRPGPQLLCVAGTWVWDWVRCPLLSQQTSKRPCLLILSHKAQASREFPYNMRSRLLEGHKKQLHRKGQGRNHVLVTVLNTSTSFVFSHLDRNSSAGVGVGAFPVLHREFWRSQEVNMTRLIAPS